MKLGVRDPDVSVFESKNDPSQKRELCPELAEAFAMTRIWTTMHKCQFLRLRHAQSPPRKNIKH